MKSKVQELMETLERGGVFTSEELSKELGIKKTVVNRLVSQARKKFLNGSDTPYVYTTGHGYTLEEDKLHVIYESGLRLKQGFGILANGVHVFGRAKKIAGPRFDNLKIAFKPKMITVDNILK